MARRNPATPGVSTTPVPSKLSSSNQFRCNGNENAGNAGGDLFASSSLNSNHRLDDRSLGVARGDGDAANTFRAPGGVYYCPNANWSAHSGGGVGRYDAMYDRSDFDPSDGPASAGCDAVGDPDELSRRNGGRPIYDVTAYGVNGADGYSTIGEAGGVFRNFGNDKPSIDEGLWQQLSDAGDLTSSDWSSPPPPPPPTTTDCSVSYLDYGGMVPPPAAPPLPPGPPPVLLTSYPSATSKDIQATTHFDSSKVMRLRA